MRHIVIKKEIHKEISKIASWNEIKIQDLCSELLSCMLTEHKEQVDAIVKILKLNRKSQ